MRVWSDTPTNWTMSRSGWPKVWMGICFSMGGVANIVIIFVRWLSEVGWVSSWCACYCSASYQREGKGCGWWLGKKVSLHSRWIVWGGARKALEPRPLLFHSVIALFKKPLAKKKIFFGERIKFCIWSPAISSFCIENWNQTWKKHSIPFPNLPAHS